jgi:hypothetical protein
MAAASGQIGQQRKGITGSALPWQTAADALL